MTVLIKILYTTHRAVPFPFEMNGHCVYGHILTDKHINHFRLAYPDCPEWQSSDPESLVSIASMLIPGMHNTYTADVYDEQLRSKYALSMWKVGTTAVFLICGGPGRMIL